MKVEIKGTLGQRMKKIMFLLASLDIKITIGKAKLTKNVPKNNQG